MLSFIPGETYSQRIQVKSPLPGLVCWIAFRPVYNPELRDWVLFIKRGNEPARSGKCPTQLEIESHLRSWLLRHHKRRLFSTRFADLRRIAEGKHPRQQLEVRRRTLTEW
jgi:hypothetical protein